MAHRVAHRVAHKVAHRVAHKVAHRVAHGLAHGPRPRFCPHPFSLVWSFSGSEGKH